MPEISTLTNTVSNSLKASEDKLEQERFRNKDKKDRATIE
jgi:hypothetical protein